MKGILVFLLVLVSLCFGGQFINFPLEGRQNMLFIPSAAGNGTKPLPLFVMLHGCTQDPSDFADGSKMNIYGEQFGLYVVYPEQPTSANIDKCWNWFLPADQSRGSGEPQIIVTIAQAVMAKYNVDNSSVFVAGLSAGAAMSDILGATYPDLFRGAVVGSGLEYQAATSAVGAYIAMDEGGPNPETQGQVAYKAMGSYAETLLVLVTHGTADVTVFPINGEQVTDSYTKTLDYVLGNGHSYGYITSTPTTTTKGQVPGGHSYTTNTYDDSKTGETFVCYILVNGMAHAWSGGSSSGTFTDPEGPDASLIMINWFLFGNLTVAPPSSTTTTSEPTSASYASVTASATTNWITSSTGTSSGSGSSSGPSSTTGSNHNSTIVLTSIGSEDGFVGKLITEGYSTTICKIGSAGFYSEDDYRTILSFDSSSLGDYPNVTNAVLTITQVGLNGTLQPLVVDLKQGTFGDSTQLEELDYYGLPTVPDVGLIDIPEGNGQSSSFTFPYYALPYINGEQDRIQIMLRQDILTTIPSATADVLQIVDGGATLTLYF